MLHAHWLPTCQLQMYNQAHPGVVSSLTLMGTLVYRVNITLFSVRIKLVIETIRKVFTGIKEQGRLKLQLQLEACHLKMSNLCHFCFGLI